MTAFEEWLGTYLGSQDDATLVVWSSKGLVEKAKAELAKRRDAAEIVVGEDNVQVSNIGSDVVLNKDGLPASTCTCPAPRACKHRVVAALLLRERFASDAAGDEPDGLPTLLEELTPEQARELFGARRWSKAKRALADGLEVEVSTEHGTQITLVGLGIQCSFPPAVGLEGSLCTCKKAFPCGHRALAVAGLLAARESLQNEPLRERSSLDWDHPGLLNACDAFLERIAQVGLEHTSLLWRRTATRLAVGAHVLSLADLERDLARLARLLGSRHAVDIADCGTALATCALRVHLLRSEPSLEHAGSFRRGYFDVGTVTLSCVGAVPWQTARGMRGVELLFFDGERILSHLVRIDSGDVYAFGRRRHRGQRVWNAGRWDELVGHRVHLQHARLTLDGRLSGTKETHAAILEEFAPTELDWGNLQANLWRPLVQVAQRNFSMEVFQETTYRVLSAQRFGDVTWEPSTRSVVVPMLDEDGSEVECRIAVGASANEPQWQIASRAVHWIQHEAPNLALGEVYVKNDRLAFSPAVFFRSGRGPKAIEMLAFSKTGGTPLAVDDLPVTTPYLAQPQVSDQAMDWLCSVLQGGLQKLTAHQQEEQQRIQSSAVSAGFATLAAHLEEATTAPGAMLRAWVAVCVAGDLVRDARLREALGG